jgi:uncharacterized protein
MKTVACPHCKKPVPWVKESIYRPFCSERCKLIDLGAWADGSYSIPMTGVPTDEDEFDDSVPDDTHDEE